MKILRKHFVAAAGGAFSALALPKWAGAAEFNYRLGTDFPVSHPVVLRSSAAAVKIRARDQRATSKSTSTTTTFPRATTHRWFFRTRLGGIEFTQVNQGAVETVVPAVGLQVVPFAFANYNDVWNAMDGAVGKYIRDAVVKANVGLYPFATMWTSGFRQVSNNVRPIKTPADFKGLKIRTTDAPIIHDAFKALGAIPVSVSGGEIYTALQTRLVDGGDITLVSVESSKFYEVQKFISLTNHQWQGNHMLASSLGMQKLPPAFRDIVERNFNAAALLDRDDIAKSDQTLRGTSSMWSHGMSFNTTDIQAFRASIRSAGLYASWRDKFGAASWGLLEQTVGKL